MFSVTVLDSIRVTKRFYSFAEGYSAMSGFPITRIDPKADKVVQQFVGGGGGFIRASQGAVWLTNVKQGTVWRIDPRRVVATLTD